MGVSTCGTFLPAGGVGSAAGSSVEGWGCCCSLMFCSFNPEKSLGGGGRLHIADLHVWWSPVSILLLCFPLWFALWNCIHPEVAAGVFFHRGVMPGWWFLKGTAAVYRGRPSCSKPCLKRGVVLSPPNWIPLQARWAGWGVYQLWDGCWARRLAVSAGYLRRWPYLHL